MITYEALVWTHMAITCICSLVLALVPGVWASQLWIDSSISVFFSAYTQYFWRAAWSDYKQWVDYSLAAHARLPSQAAQLSTAVCLLGSCGHSNTRITYEDVVAAC